VSAHGLPDLPRPASAVVTREITISMPGDLLADLETAAKTQGMDLATALVQCVVLWRYPAPVATAARARRRTTKRA